MQISLKFYSQFFGKFKQRKPNLKFQTEKKSVG